MMFRELRDFVDLPPAHWAYHPVRMLSGVKWKDGQYLINNIPYGVFEEGKPAVNYVKVIERPEDISDHIVVPNMVFEDLPENPVMVMKNYKLERPKNITADHGDPKTFIYFHRTLRLGDIIWVRAPGVPVVDSEGYPVHPGSNFVYPRIKIKMKGGEYLFDPLHPTITEIALSRAKGQLYRVNTEADISEPFHYTVVEEGGEWYLVVHPEINNIQTKFTYISKTPDPTSSTGFFDRKITEFYFPVSDNLVYTDRFFPNVKLTRAQLFTFANRFRIYIIRRFTAMTLSQLRSNKQMSQSVFSDVRSLSEEPWWWEHVRDMEDLVLEDDSYIMNFDSEGKAIPEGGGNRDSSAKLNIDEHATRAEVAWLLNKLRKYFMESIL